MGVDIYDLLLCFSPLRIVGLREGRGLRGTPRLLYYPIVLTSHCSAAGGYTFV